jgi:D-glycero-alpha-D-manno-heptose-7-phosphate kinase
MLYTGITRSADKILKEQSINTRFDEEKRFSLRKMTELAGELRDALVCNDLDGFGEILHQGWMEKRKLAAGISNQRIDEWYAIARQHGAVGGKVLGAGGGGFLLLFAPPESFQDIMRALPDLKPVPFNFEPQGSKIIYVEENGDST